jgi:hypothetical protein
MKLLRGGWQIVKAFMARAAATHPPLVSKECTLLMYMIYVVAADQLIDPPWIALSCTYILAAKY